MLQTLEAGVKICRSMDSKVVAEWLEYSSNKSVVGGAGGGGICQFAQSYATSIKYYHSIICRHLNCNWIMKFKTNSEYYNNQFD